MKKEDSYVHYITERADKDRYPIYATTMGYQTIAPHQHYPPEGKHPDGYFFRKGYGRVLPEYQLVYVSEGSGYFESTHCPRTWLSAGTFIMLFPGEWHYYEPDQKTGWTEYWVGFKMSLDESLVSKLSISPERPLIRVNFATQVLSLYDELIHVSKHEIDGFQYICNGIISHLLGYISYSMTNKQIVNRVTLDIMDRARAIMRTQVGKNVSPEAIAAELGVGYSWFRQTFKDVVGVSPAQYQQQLRMLRAEFLLTNPSSSISDIAYELGFANSNQFSTFFKLHKNITPMTYRKLLKPESQGSE